MPPACGQKSSPRRDKAALPGLAGRCLLCWALLAQISIAQPISHTHPVIPHFATGMRPKAQTLQGYKAGSYWKESQTNVRLDQIFGNSRKWDLYCRQFLHLM